MFRKTKYLGISMAPQRNRRWMVVITYAAVVLLVTTHAMRHRATSFGDLNFEIVFALLLASRVVFGYLVPTFPFSANAASVSSVPEVKSIMHPERNEPFRDDERDPSPPDEREIIVRNRAYYLAFNIVLSYALVAFCSIGYLADLRVVHFWTAATLSRYAFLPLIVMALTLPQAIILWTEPDFVELEG